MREHVVIAGVVPVHMRADDVIDLVRRHPDGTQPLVDRVDDLAAALVGGGLIEAGVADEGAVRAFDRPDVI
jgi:hypothetical protein